MNNRVLVPLAIAIVLGLFTTPVSAQKPKKAKVENKSPRIPVVSCDLYSKGTYLTGRFHSNVLSTTDRFTREGLSMGTGCNYRSAHGKFSLEIGAEFYFGNLNLVHEEGRLKGSFSYLETGFKEWVRTALTLRKATVGLGVGVQKTTSSRFEINSLLINLWDTEYDFTKFGDEHLTSEGELEVWETGLDVSFPFRRNFFFMFGAQWQRYIVKANMDLDMEAKAILEVLYVNSSSINKKLDRTEDFFYLMPGVKWCGKKLCASLVVPWSAFISEAQSWGSTLQVEMKF